MVLVLVFGGWYVLREDQNGRNMYERYRAYRQSEEQVAAAEVRLKALESALEKAEARVGQLEADPVEVEAAVRRIKGLIRPGEIVFRLKPAEPQDADGLRVEEPQHRTELSN